MITLERRNAYYHTQLLSSPCSCTSVCSTLLLSFPYCEVESQVLDTVRCLERVLPSHNHSTSWFLVGIVPNEASNIWSIEVSVVAFEEKSGLPAPSSYQRPPSSRILGLQMKLLGNCSLVCSVMSIAVSSRPSLRIEALFTNPTNSLTSIQLTWFRIFKFKPFRTSWHSSLY